VPTEVRRDDDGSVDVFYVGEAPGEEEDRQSLPFVGRSGVLLRSLVKQTVPGGKEKGVAYGNLLKCRYGERSWPESSAPKAAKICRTYLLDEIKKVRPKVVVPMGTNALRELFKTQDSISAVRGNVKLESYGKSLIPTLYTYHPAAALRKPQLASVIRMDFWRAGMVAKHGYELEVPTSKLGTVVYLDKIEMVKEVVDCVLNKLDDSDVIGLDVEAKNLNKRYGNKLATVQISWNHDTSYVIPYAHPETPWDVEELQQVRELLIKLFTAKAKFKYWITWNGKTEDMILRQELGVYPSNAPMLDGQQMLFLIDENRIGLRETKGKKALDPFALEQCAQEFLEFYHYTRYEKDVLRKRVMESSLRDVVAYGGKDAYVTRRLFDVLLAFCEPDYVKKMLRLARRLYSPATHAFAVIETNGFAVDRKQARYLLRDDSPIAGRLREILEIAKKNPNFQKANDLLIRSKIGDMKTLFKKPWVFDFNKTAHLRTLFYEVMGLDEVTSKKQKTKTPTVGKLFRTEHWNAEDGTGVAEVGLYHEFQELGKLLGTYLTDIMERVRPGAHEDYQDCRIRPSFGLINTVTARTNSYNPNLQQVPGANTPVKKAIKDLYIAEPGTVLLEGDFMAFEVRWLAITTGDTVLGELFWNGKKLRNQFRKNPTKALKELAEFEGDIHRSVAALIFNVKIKDVTGAQRDAAKRIVFGLAYGKHTRTLAQELGISEDEAEEIVEKIFGRFKRMRRWYDETEAHGQKYGWVESALGRRRRISEYLIGDVMRGNRLARNSPIQSAASDTCIIGISLLQQWIEDNNLENDWKIQNAVHDAFLLQVPIADVRKATRITERIFTTDVPDYIEKYFSVSFETCPLEVEYKFGTRWGSMVKWDFSDPQMLLVEDWLKKGGNMKSKKDADVVNIVKWAESKEAQKQIKKLKAA
jgi:uracil-DNA glycosylase family 4